MCVTRKNPVFTGRIGETGPRSGVYITGIDVEYVRPWTVDQPGFGVLRFRIIFGCPSTAREVTYQLERAGRRSAAVQTCVFFVCAIVDVADMLLTPLDAVSIQLHVAVLRTAQALVQEALERRRLGRVGRTELMAVNVIGAEVADGWCAWMWG